MSKYYTPTKDEFFDGFRFEALIHNEYEDAIYDNDELLDLHMEKSRVRYLDLDDLRDLGFNIKQEHNDYTVLYKNVISEKPTYFILIFREEFGKPMIELMDMYNHTLMAKVHIKNRNELEWLLNRYGIL